MLFTQTIMGIDAGMVVILSIAACILYQDPTNLYLPRGVCLLLIACLWLANLVACSGFAGM